MPLCLWISTALAALLAGSPLSAWAEGAEAKAVVAPAPTAIEDAIPEGSLLTGRELYGRFLKNKLHAAVQRQRVTSTDPGGNAQESIFWVRWKDYRAREQDKIEGVLAKTILRFIDPPDLRNTGYLMIVRDDRSHDQFVYQPSERRVRRVNVKDATIAGTDYNFDDISYQDIEDADYTRLPDEEIQGLPVFVIEARLRPRADSRYSRTIKYIEKEHYVALRGRYWDRADVEIKEMIADVATIQEFGGFWVATRSRMTNLVEETFSETEVLHLDPNPEIAEQFFSVFRLQVLH